MRSVPPPSIPPFDITKFLHPLDDFNRREITASMGCKTLPEDVVGELEYLIAAYWVHMDKGVGALSTTVGASIAAIDDQLDANAACVKKLTHFTNERSGIDAESFDALNPHALVLRQTIEEFDKAAHRRKTELKSHDRVNPATEALKYFCAMLSGFFKEHTTSSWRIGGPGRRRKFALAVLSAAGVEATAFINQPKRLDEYLDIFIPAQDLPPHWVKPGRRRPRPT